MKTKGLFITGTDTGCGKTEITLALMRLLQDRGYRVLGMKPVASGAEESGEGLRNEDALRLEVAVAAFVFWFLVSGESLVFALTVAVTVLVIACPHALGLAIPVVTTISTSLAARVGMLNRNADVSRRGLGHFHGVGEDL